MFDIAWPWAFVLLVLPVLMRYLVPRSSQTHGSALKIPFYNRVSKLNTYNEFQTILVNRRLQLLYLIYFLLVIALSGPQWLGAPVSLPQKGRDIMLAVDTSGSMTIQDMGGATGQTSRFEAVKKVAGNFVEERKGDRVGLILFGSNAYIQAPLTFDRKTVKTLLDESFSGIAGKQTAIGDAMILGVDMLKDVPKKSRILILLTDGANNAGQIDPQQAIAVAKEYGIKIYTVGIGGGKMLVQSFFGNQYVSTNDDLDENLLRQIAKETGGHYFRASDAKGLQQAYQAIDKLEPIASQKDIYRPMTPLYPWPLGLALIISVGMLWPRWRWFRRAVG